MADTGENRQIVGRANAKEAETIRASKRDISKERSTEKASVAIFRTPGTKSRSKSKGSQQSADPKAPKR
jgi:hypothetical protein